MRHLLITGATGGIARALIRRVGDAQLTLVARDAAKLRTLIDDLRASAPWLRDPPTWVAADLSDEAGAITLANHLADRPPLDGAVHAVGSLLLKPCLLYTSPSPRDH
jgi:NAD(P)-dependent dehydrogenase (short-subunit alcohol dehydrogenase family)